MGITAVWTVWSHPPMHNIINNSITSIDKTVTYIDTSIVNYFDCIYYKNSARNLRSLPEADLDPHEQDDEAGAPL